MRVPFVSQPGYNVSSNGGTTRVLFTGPGRLRIEGSPDEVVGTRRSAGDLVIQGKDGQVIVLKNYFLQDPLPEVTFHGEGGQVWSFTPTTASGPFSFAPLLSSPAPALYGAGLGGGAGLAALGAVAAVGVASRSNSNSTFDFAPAGQLPAVDSAHSLSLSADSRWLSGQGTPGAFILLRDAAGNGLASGVIPPSGQFSLNLPDSAREGGALSLELTAPNGASAPPTVIVAPDLTAPSLTDQLIISPDGSLVTGKTEPGATVLLRDEAGVEIGRVTAGPDGVFTLPLDPPQVMGDTLTLTLQDGAGNLSGEYPLASPDFSTPAAPSGLHLTGGGMVVEGHGAPNMTVVVFNPAGDLIGSGVTNADGSFAVSILSGGATNGSALSVQLVSPSQVASPATAILSMDLVAPDAANSLAIGAHGQRMTGTGEPGAQVQVYSSTGTLIASGTVPESGSFALTLTPPQFSGDTLQVQLTDPSNNSSQMASITAPVLLPPGAATNLQISADGSVLAGTGEVHASVILTNASGTILGRTLVQTDGTFDVLLIPPVVDGSALRVTLSTVVGTSPDSFVITPDLIAPPAPTALVLSADGTTATGQGEPGATVRVRTSGGTLIGTATVGLDGTFTATLSPPATLSDTLEVRQSDLSSNLSPPTYLVSHDITAPTPAGNLVFSADGRSLTGTGENNARVELKNAANELLASGTVNENGAFTLLITPPLTAGQALSVYLSDAAANVSGPSPVSAPDLTPPDPATALAVNVASSTLTGLGEAGAAVSVVLAGSGVIGTGVVAADGTFSVALDPMPSSGATLRVTLTDAAGNISAPSDLVSPDLTPPTAATALALSADGAVLTGEGEPNASVIVFLGDNPTPVGTATVAANGTFQVSLTPPQLNGGTLNVFLADAAGNNSAPAYLHIPDLTPPAAPIVLVLTPDGLTLSGTGEASTTVHVTSASGAVLGTALVGLSGAFTAVLSTPQLNAEVLHVTLEDSAGLRSPTVTFTASDVTPPNAVSNLWIDPTNGLTVTGSGQSGATVQAKIAATGDIIGTATVNSSGQFTIPLSLAMIDGRAIEVVQIDTGGASAPSQITSPDLTPPDRAQIISFNDTTGEIMGSAEPRASVLIMVTRGGIATEAGFGQVADDGTFFATLFTAVVPGETYQVFVKDAAGNISAPADGTVPLTWAPNPDTTAPAQPTHVVFSSDGQSLSGEGEAGARVLVRDSTGTLIGLAVVLPSGDFNVHLTPALRNGELVSVVQNDAAGNVSPPVSLNAPDLVAPDAPVITSLSADGAILLGTGEPNAILQLKNAAGVLIVQGSVNGVGTFNLTLTPPVVTGERLTLVQIDLAGQQSAPATTLTPDLTPPDAPTVASLTGSGTQLNGTGEAGAVVQVRLAGGGLLGEALVSPTGSFSVTLTPAQRNGGVLEVRQVDGAGNLSAPSGFLVPDVTPPAAATHLSLNLLGTELSGEGEPGATVTVRGPSGTVLGAGTVQLNGTFLVSLVPAMLNGEVLRVTLTDGAGLVSPVASLNAADITPPDMAQNLVVNGSGTVLTGTGEAGATITIRNMAGTAIATGQVTETGAFSIALTPAVVTGETLRVTLTDGAGLSSVAANIASPDLTPPAPLSGLGVDATGFTLTGMGEVGARVEALDARGAVLGSATVAGNGSFTLSLTPPQVEGQTLSVRQFDGAGNASPNSTVTGPNLLPLDTPQAQDNSLTLIPEVVPQQRALAVQPSAGGFSTASIGLGAVLGANILTGANALIVEVADYTTRLITLRAEAGGVALLSRFDLELRRFDADLNGWVAVGTKPGLLQVGLLGGVSDPLTLSLEEPGRYALFLRPAAGVSVLTGYSLEMQSDVLFDYATPAGATGTVSGNVITDADGSTGLIDQVRSGTVIAAVNGTAIGAPGTVINGQWGVLTISPDGSYSYSLKPGFANAWGQEESFTYKLSYTNAGGRALTDTATLSIAFERTPVDPEPLLINVPLTATPTVKPVLATDTGFAAAVSDVSLLRLSLITPILSASALNFGSSMRFNVADNTLRDMTFEANYGGLGLGANLGLMVYKRSEVPGLGDQWVQHHFEPNWLQVALIAGVATPLKLTFSAGEYVAFLAGDVALSILDGTTLSASAQSVTDFNAVTSLTGAQSGDLTTGDLAPAVILSLNGTAVPVSGSITLDGQYGRLTLAADGTYSYTAFNTSTPGFVNPLGEQDIFSLRISENGVPRILTLAFALDALTPAVETVVPFSVQTQWALSPEAVQLVAASGNLASTSARTQQVIEITDGAAKAALITASVGVVGYGNTALTATLHRMIAATDSNGDGFDDVTLRQIRLDSTGNRWVIADGPAVYSKSLTSASPYSPVLSVSDQLQNIEAGHYYLEVNATRPNTASINWSTGLLTFDYVPSVTSADLTGTIFASSAPEMAAVSTLVLGGQSMELLSLGGRSSLTLEGEHGSLTLHKDGSYSYDPTGESFGVDVFSYSLVSITGGQTSNSLSFTVEQNTTGSTAADYLRTWETLDTFTLGSGADVVQITEVSDQADIWKDFNLSEGDSLDLSALIVGLTSSNLASHVAVAQVGGNTQVSLSVLGDGSFENVMVLENTSHSLQDLTPGLLQFYA